MKNKTRVHQSAGPVTLPWRKGLLPLAATLALAGAAFDAQAVTLGAITVRSSLGQPLRAEIEVPQLSSEEAATFSASMASPEAFDQLGVEFNPALAGTKVTLERRRNGQAYLRVVGSRPVNEPFLGLVIKANTDKGNVLRDYTLLVDPARTAAPAPAPAARAERARPAVTSPRVAPQKVATAEQVRPTNAGARRRRRAPAADASVADVPSPITGEGGQVTVKRGDTAGAIARRYAAPGVSLDQMLVAMLRANPRAFIKGNVNLIRTGAVLNMPSAEQAAATPHRQARRTVVAQTRDFVAYRRGLASHIAGTAERVPEASRKASGDIQPQVSDTKAPAQPKDVVEMSRASAPASAASTETAVSRSRQARESAARADELKRNIEELERLQPGASTPAPAASSAKPSVALPVKLPGVSTPAPAPSATATAAKPAPAAASAPAFQPVVPVPPPSVPLVQFPSVPAAAPSAPATTSTPASTAAPAVVLPSAPASAAASQPVSVASGPAPVASVQLPVPVIDLPSKPASAAAAPAKPAPKQPTRTPAKQPEKQASGGGGGSPLLPIGAGALVALLLGYGGWRMLKKKKDTALSSDFVGSENSSQAPNSWLGSGDGQALDSKAGEASAVGGLSMIYSPSQLDAAGDVDPVAEADVYLAYGRDVQAEEILREALITQPNRTAIHRKLAEIYSKRRDSRALEDIAQKAHTISGGHGIDWQAIATLGSELDPDNPLYRGEAPNSTAPDSQQSGRPAFGADTVPLSAQSEQPEDSGSLDIDLGDDVGEESAPGQLGVAPPTTIDPPASLGGSGSEAASAAPYSNVMDFPLDEEVKLDAPAEPAPTGDTGAGMLDFNMEELNADQEARSAEGASTEQPADADENPLATQLELAKEFHSIGDVEGARKMVLEVIKEAEGKDEKVLARAQRFLAELDQ